MSQRSPERNADRPWPSYSDVGIYSAVIRHGLRFDLHTPPHTFRRSFGRHLYKRGAPLVELKTLMGHASIEQTISYLGIGECDLQDAMSFRPSYREIARKAFLSRLEPGCVKT